MKLTANVPHALSSLRGALEARRGRDFISSFIGSPTVDTWAGLCVTCLPDGAVLALLRALTRGLVGPRADDLGRGSLLDEAAPALTIGIAGSVTVDLGKGRLLDKAVPVLTLGLVRPRTVDLNI